MMYVISKLMQSWRKVSKQNNFEGKRVIETTSGGILMNVALIFLLT